MGSTLSLFDPRVQYDDDWNRFVVTSDSFPVDSTHQYFWIAVSKTSNPAGAWFVYPINTNSFTGTGSLWDFPSLGLQQDSIIITANVFGTSTFLGASTFALAKAQAYNGFKQGFPVFGGLWATLQPPKVQKNDLNGFAWLAAAPPGSGAIYMYALENPSSPNNTLLFGPYTVTGVGAYTVPVPASQTCGGGANALDTSDNRFVNASTQVGDKLYQVHSVGSLATIRYYVITGLSSFKPAVAETGDFFSTLSSSDYNASIAADASDNLAIAWTETDTSGGVNAAVRYVGRQAGDAASSGAVGASLITSTGCLTGNFDSNFGMQRWGDYSQVTADPKTAKTFWIINEDILADMGSSQWGNEIGKIHF